MDVHYRGQVDMAMGPIRQAPVFTTYIEWNARLKETKIVADD